MGGDDEFRKELKSDEVYWYLFSNQGNNKKGHNIEKAVQREIEKCYQEFEKDKSKCFHQLRGGAHVVFAEDGKHSISTKREENADLVREKGSLYPLFAEVERGMEKLTYDRGGHFAIEMLPAGGVVEAEVKKRFYEGMNQNAAMRIMKIEVVRNKFAWEKFMSEFKLMREKYPASSNKSLVKSLFHGSKSPYEVARSEKGFDMCFANQGAWGRAFYFAKQS